MLNLYISHSFPLLSRFFLSISFYSGVKCGEDLGTCPDETPPEATDVACADIDKLKEAESTCTATNGCVKCHDDNFGSNCDGNRAEHCAEIACCPECEDEILAMFGCEQ